MSTVEKYRKLSETSKLSNLVLQYGEIEDNLQLFITNTLFRYIQSHGDKFIPGTEYAEKDKKEIIGDVLKMVISTMSPTFYNELLIIYNKKEITQIIFELTAITLNVQLEQISSSGVDEDDEQTMIFADQIKNMMNE